MEEVDPAKSHAFDSSLWEIQVHVCDAFLVIL